MKTLHTRLVLLLLALVVPLSVLFVIVTLRTSRQYYQEITQQQNSGLAEAILSDEPNLMLDPTAVDTAKFDKVASTFAMTNPGVEIYILEPDGHIIGSSLDMNELERKYIDITVIEAFLSDSATYPLMGTDPRRLEGGKIFSVAPLVEEDGYVYVLLADRVGDSIIRTVQNSTVLRLGLWSGVTLVALILGVAGLAFGLLTRRLRRLNTAMSAFRENDFVVDAPLAMIERPQDEIDTLQNVFGDMAQRISEQVQGLRQVDRLRRELITNVSHDLRTPLAALQGYLETLELKGDLNDEAKGYLDAAGRHSERLERLISDLFDLSRLDAQAVEARLEPFPIAELAQDVVLKFQGQAQNKCIKLELRTPENLPFVAIDVGLMERALTNLIDNALRYTPRGGRVRLSLKAHGEAVVVQVRDNGRGISETDLPHVFERFYRASKHEGPEGSGLGLAITKRIVALHDSTIHVQSRLGEGTIFSFMLGSKM